MELIASVTGEKVITPSAIVHLTYKCRYVYPTTSVPKSQLPNGHLALPNGNHDSGKKDTAEEAEADGASGADVESEKPNVKDKVEGAKEAIADTKSKVVGQKGKEATAKVNYPPNGYAHAPHWPLVRSLIYFGHIKDTADPETAKEAPLLRALGRLET